MKPVKIGLTEQRLIVVASVIVILSAYGLLRVKDKEAEINIFKEELAIMQSDIDGMKPARLTGEPINLIRLELEKEKKKLQELNNKIQAASARMVGADAGQVVQDVMFEVSQLAVQVNVKLLNEESHTAFPDGMNNTTKNPALEGRVLRKVSLKGTYQQLTHFFQAINQLKFSVKVLSLNLTSGAYIETTESPELLAEAVILL